MARRKMETKAWRASAGGNVKLLVRISEDQDRALREEAFRRAAEVGSHKPDASAVLREILADWMRQRRK